MKKFYTKPTAEKLAFQYRDQVVAASSDSSGTGGSETPEVGTMVGNQQIGSDGCSWYMFEAAGSRICDYL